MQVVISQEPQAKKEIKFPVLALSKNNGDIILFINEAEGVRLISREGLELEYSEAWVSILDENHWEILPPSFKLTLSNEE